MKGSRASSSIPADRGTTSGRKTYRRVLLLGMGVALLIVVPIAVAAANRGASAPAVPSSKPVALTAVVATVNGLDIPARELLSFVAQERAATFAYYQQHYGVGDSPLFWTIPHGGQTPQDYIKQAALADITRITVQQLLAHGYGLLPDPCYGAFVQAWLQENARRQQAIARHQVIYGPVQYSEANYFTYLVSNMVLQLERELAQRDVIPTTDAVLYPYYLSRKNAFLQARPGEHISLTQSHAHVTLVTPPFSQIRNEVEHAYVDNQYAALVDRLVRSARVVLEQAVYNAITVS